MHQAAYDFITDYQSHDPRTVVYELGSREVQGNIRPLFEGTQYTGVDAAEGPGVDVVADAASWWPEDGQRADIVVCAEVFEHTPLWPLIVRNAHDLLVGGGLAVFTCAGPGRPVHGLNTDDPLSPGWYRNVGPDDLALAMMVAGFYDIHVEILGDDTRGTGRATAVRR